jgi:CarD family transcriptional regulator
MKAPARPKAPTKSRTTAAATPAATPTTNPKATASAPPAKAKPKAAAKAVKVPTKTAPKEKAAATPVAAPPAAAKPAPKPAPPPAAAASNKPATQAAAKPQPAVAEVTERRPLPPPAYAPPPPPSRGIVSPPPPHRPPQRPSVAPAVVAAAAKVAPRPKEDFKAGDHVVYPTHGVGSVQGIETVEAAGYTLQVIVVTFEENRMTLRVPVNKAASSGLRKLAAGAAMQMALDTLKGRARIKRTMWSRRAQEYEAKINSGDPLQIAEVVRDLHRNAGQPDQSFSERQIYEQALDRLAAEVAAIDATDKQGAIDKILGYLGKADKSGKADAAEKGDDAED